MKPTSRPVLSLYLLERKSFWLGSARMLCRGCTFNLLVNFLSKANMTENYLTIINDWNRYGTRVFSFRIAVKLDRTYVLGKLRAVATASVQVSRVVTNTYCP